MAAGRHDVLCQSAILYIQYTLLMDEISMDIIKLNLCILIRNRNIKIRKHTCPIENDQD